MHVRLYFFTSSCIYHVEHSIPLRLSNFRHTHLFFTHETCVQCKHVNTNTKHTVRCSSSNTRVEAATSTPKTHSRSTQSGVEAATNTPQTHTQTHTQTTRVCRGGRMHAHGAACVQCIAPARLRVPIACPYDMRIHLRVAECAACPGGGAVSRSVSSGWQNSVWQSSGWQNSGWQNSG